MSHDFTSLVFSEAPMKSKLQEKFQSYEDKTENGQPQVQKLDDETERLMLDYCASGHMNGDTDPDGVEWEKSKAALRSRIAELIEQARKFDAQRTDVFLRCLEGELSYEGQEVVKGYLVTEAEMASEKRTLTKEDWVAMKELLDAMRIVSHEGVEVYRANASSRCTYCGADWIHRHDARGNPYPLKVDPATGALEVNTGIPAEPSRLASIGNSNGND